MGTHIRLAVVLALASWLGCTSSAPLDESTGEGGGGGAAGGRGGSAGTTGTAGATGTGGTTGVAGTMGRGGTTGGAGTTGRGGTTGGAGATGAAGTAGGGGTTGRGGTTGGAGTTGRGGTTGGAGTGGGAGTTGRGGTTGTAGTTGAAGTTGGAGTTGRGGSTGAAGTTGTAGATGGAGTTGTAGTTGAGGAAPAWNAGNPNGSCSGGIPAKGQAADTSNPTTVVGTGTAASCTFSLLQAAVAQGGVITFNCGSGAVTIPVTATLNVPSNKNTVIDGGRKITLDGGKAVQIMRFHSANFQANNNGLTLQHIALINGKQTPTEMIPTRPAPCSQGWNDGQGGALYMRDGYLTVIDAIFTGNEAAPVGPDTGGGAIYVLGSKGGVWIVNSTFTGNKASNAGAVGGLFAELNIYNSLFRDNVATGHDANGDEPSKCSYMNNDQNQTGSGGNGAAIYSDGNDVNVTLCGDAVLNNAAGTGAFGGGLFYTSNNYGGVLTIRDTTMTGNTGGHWTQVQSGSVTNAGTAVGTNCKSITLSSSTLQGVP